MIVTLLIITGVAIGGGAIYLKANPAIGGKLSQTDLERFKKSKQFNGEIFENEIYTAMDMSFTSIVSTAYQFIKGVPNSRPEQEPELIKVDSLELVKNQFRPRLIWFGHSAFLMQLGGKNILIDPMLGKVPAPSDFLGGNRYNSDLPIEIAEMPAIDAILISHDHYDHLDYKSIVQVKDKCQHFYVPLGVGAHLKEWGVAQEKITEMDWWEEQSLGEIKLAFTPARHFSGRGISDRNKTFWGSWVIKSDTSSVYFSGDGGYGPHFKEIAKKYGPFDFAMMECGQYNEKWHDIHMMPEETAQASLDINTKVMMPIHWGAFTLALHSWTDPVERVSKRLKELNQQYIIPKIGESLYLDSLPKNHSDWWKND